MESLSPLTRLEPDISVEHMEKWELFDNIQMPASDEAEIEKAITDKVRTI
jgi:hypothetical protein